MGKVLGMRSLRDNLQKRLRKAGKGTKAGTASVIVGYTQEYAIYVHENLEAYHEVGNAKFLEIPFREIEPDVPSILRKSIAAGMTLPQALLALGLKVQRTSMEQVPIDTGALRSSAFTRLEE